MTAKKLQEINKNVAYKILNTLFENHLWDPVITNSMSDIQCQNRFYNAIDEYFNNHSSLIYWNKHTSNNILLENNQVIPMMKEYNFNKYKEEHNF